VENDYSFAFISRHFQAALVGPVREAVFDRVMGVIPRLVEPNEDLVGLSIFLNLGYVSRLKIPDTSSEFGNLFPSNLLESEVHFS